MHRCTDANGYTNHARTHVCRYDFVSLALSLSLSLSLCEFTHSSFISQLYWDILGTCAISASLLISFSHSVCVECVKSLNAYARQCNTSNMTTRTTDQKNKKIILTMKIVCHICDYTYYYHYQYYSSQ